MPPPHIQRTDGRTDGRTTVSQEAVRLPENCISPRHDRDLWPLLLKTISALRTHVIKYLCQISWKSRKGKNIVASWDAKWVLTTNNGQSDGRILWICHCWTVCCTFQKLNDWLIENYTVFQISDAKIEITITTTNLIRIRYPLSSFKIIAFLVQTWHISTKFPAQF